jgi:HK97 family phage portal protein
MERIVKNVAIYGNAFVVKLGMDGEAGTPSELFPAPSIGWKRGNAETYIWTSEKGDPYTFQRWQVMHYTFWDLDECGFGMSMLEPLRSTLAVENAARRYAVASFKQGARPGSVLKTDQKLKPETATALRTHMETLHGGPDNAFKIAVLEQGLDWAPFPQDNLEDAALINHRQLTQEEVAAVLDVPQPTMGILRNANFASIDMLHTMLYQDSCGPWAVMIEDTTQTDLVDVTPAFKGQFVEIDMNGVMRGDLLSRVRAYATQITSGQKTLDEIRRLENDPPMADTQPEAGRLLIPMNMSGATGAQLTEDSGQEDNTNA